MPGGLLGSQSLNLASSGLEQDERSSVNMSKRVEGKHETYGVDGGSLDKGRVVGGTRSLCSMTMGLIHWKEGQSDEDTNLMALEKLSIDLFDRFIRSQTREDEITLCTTREKDE